MKKPLTLPSFENTEIAFKYRNTRELKTARFLFSSMAHPLLTRMGIAVTQWAFKLHLPISSFIRSTIFRQFCGGETLAQAGKTAARIAPFGVDVILDYGVEGKNEEKAFDAAVPEFIKAINYAAGNKDIPFISLKVTGFARFDLLAKINEDKVLSQQEEQEWQYVQNRIEQICAAAAEKKVMVLIDAEESWIQKPVDALADNLMKKHNQSEAIVFNTFQLYRHDRLTFLQASHKRAVENNYVLGAKLVRGAYMEKERARAQELNYPSPIQPNKEACDKDFNEATQYCLRNLKNIMLFIGTHNEKSCLDAASSLIEQQLEGERVYFSQLFGMGDNLSFNLADAGFQVAKYLPYGPVQDVMPYLMRRAEENTSIAGQTGRELLLIKKELARRNQTTH